MGRFNEEHKQRKTTIDEAELRHSLEALEAKPEFFRLRNVALLSLMWLVGKRRSEYPRLELTDFEEGAGVINVTFTLSKKRGEMVISKRSTKTLKLSDPLTQPIAEYLNYLKHMNPTPRYFLPRVYPLFGHGFIIDTENGIGGRQVYNIVAEANPDTWPHLYRESAGAEIVKGDNTLNAVFKVQRRLDHEKLATSLGYLRRYGADVIDREEKA